MFYVCHSGEAATDDERGVLAALCLAKMCDRGLGVQKDEAKMLAWLMWSA